MSSPSTAPSASSSRRKIASILSHSLHGDRESSKKTAPALHVRWDDGPDTWEPVSRLVGDNNHSNDDPDRLLKVVRYLHQRGLLIPAAATAATAATATRVPHRDDEGEDGVEGEAAILWSRQLPDHVRGQLPVVLEPDPLHETYHDDLRHLDVVHQAIQGGFSKMVTRRRSASDNSYRALREGVFEIFVDGATTRVPVGSTGGDDEEGAYNLGDPSGGSNGGGDPEASLVDVPKGSRQYQAMVRKLKHRLTSCLPEGDGTIEERSIHALTSFARRTAARDPSLSELKKLSNVTSMKVQASSYSEVSPAAPSTPPDTVTPSPSEDGADASGRAMEKEDDDDDDADAGPELVFGSFSCLVSAEGRDAQFRHVDAHSYERQYCMAISGGTSRPTVTHLVVDRMETPAHVVQVWIDLVRDYALVHPSFDRASDVLADDAALLDVADSIRTMMEGTSWMTEWIAEYGKVLSRPSRTVEVCGTWSPGTIVSVPGGNVHHAPPNEDFRDILFFTSSPVGMKPYDVDMQFSGPTLTASLVLGLCDNEAVTELHREFLRRVQYMSVWEDPCPIDFTIYLHDAIPLDDPIRVVMLQAHRRKLSKLAADAAAKERAEAQAALVVDEGGIRNVRPRKKSRKS